MTRKSDITELMKEVEEIINSLSDTYQKAKLDFSITQIPRVKVKSAIEHLRSILDYCAMDAYEFVYKKKPGKLYFPYAKNEALFNKHLSNSFHGLRQKNLKIYNILSSVQPHSCGSDWLVDLCALTNINKHTNLSNQVKKTKDSVTVGNLFKVSGNSTITVHNFSINGVQLGKDSSTPVVISDSMTNEQIETQLNPRNPFIKVTRVADEVSFLIDQPGIDALTFLQLTKANIDKLVQDLYNELNC